MNELKDIIESSFEHRAEVTPRDVKPALRDAINETIDLLDRGLLRIAEKTDAGWQVNQWAKMAVLLYFRIHENLVIEDSHTRYFDKIPLKYEEHDIDDFHRDGTRVVPDAIVRKGAFIGSNTVLMPSYVNIGAYVGDGCMIDTWATVGSCAQIGNNVHLSGGTGIGGVLEPLQANPTIIEDDCFIGARSEIVEGVIIEKGAVISMGVYIGQSTRIYDRERDEILQGRVPAGSVVVPGSLPSDDGRYSLSCAIIVKRVDAATRAKTAINELLRNIS